MIWEGNPEVPCTVRRVCDCVFSICNAAVRVADMRRLNRQTWTWIGLLSVTGGVLLLAVSPPLLSAKWQSIVLHVFSPVCHQIPVRSPHIGGVQLAICDRCTGIYLGLVLGVATVGWGRGLWRAAGQYSRFVLLGSLLLMGIDWLGPLLGLWANGPVSRASTGLLFGVVAASFVTDRLLKRALTAQPAEPEDRRTRVQEV